MATKLEDWAVPRLQQLLPLDDDSLKQVVQYADTLSKDAAAEHLKNLLGDDAKALEFISGFNLRRQNAPSATLPTNHDRIPASAVQPSGPSSAAAADAPPSRGGGARGGRGGRKKANIHALPARRVEGHGDVSGGYVKDAGQEYIPTSSRQKHKDVVADNLALREKAPDATQMPLITDDAAPTSKSIASKPPPSAAGSLISDSLAPRKATSEQSSRSASPAPKTKVNISGGTAMHGASTILSDLDSAIRSLEIQTNPTLSTPTTSASDIDKRKCTCMATRHPLLDIAPNCLSCGQIICVKQGLGPCTFCNTPLLTPDDISKVLRVLKEERGEERMRANNAAHKKADVAHGKTRAFTGRDFLAQVGATSSASTRSNSPLSSAPGTPAGSDDEAGKEKAKAHRDRLLGFQAQNARRTRVHDEAADYEGPDAGTSMWASPAERAQQLKRQQRVLREMEWSARPEYEKRRVVASIDLKGGKVVRRMAEVEKPDFGGGEEEGEGEGEGYVAPVADGGKSGGGGAFSNNPLAKGLIKPKAREEKGKGVAREERSTWRRVQMDEDDNEGWILDGGAYGGQTSDDALGAEEHAFGAATS